MKKTVIILLLASQFAKAQVDTVGITPNLIVEGIPAIPMSVATAVKAYSEARVAQFCSWHPKQKEIIIATRFANVPQLHHVRMPLGDRKQLTFFDEPITNATYDPVNGKYLLFSRDVGGNEFSQLYRYDFIDGKVTQLTEGKRTQNSGIKWSNKGNIIAYTSTRRNGADRDIYIMNPVQPSSDKMLVVLQGGGWRINDWSADDKLLLVTEYVSANESHYWLVNSETGEKKALTNRSEKHISNGNAAFSKDGKGIFFLTDRDNEFTRLAYMDLTSQKIIYLTRLPWNVEDFDLSKDGKQLAFATNEAGISKLYLMNTTERKYKPVSNVPVGVYTALKFHNNSRDLAVNINSSQSPADVYVLSTSDGKLTRWTESETGGIATSLLQMPTLIRWSSFDGKEITGFYYKPAPRFSGKRPVIINIHGGPEGQARPVFQGGNNYYLNELGAAIIFPNVRGSAGYGKSFLAADNGMQREATVKDIGSLIDWIGRQPDLDASRIMITGGSYGGYMTLAVATMYNEKIRCAIDIVGISNFNTFLKNTESYRRDLRRVEYGDERDPAMAAFFERIAPINNAGKITKPLFIVQGGNDPRVPRTEAIQMADKIKKNNGVVWYLEAKDEGHGFAKKNNADFLRYASVLFVNLFLLDAEDTKIKAAL